jgi:D-psicose/D-tagatose/L-ribulose 3-epimerase
VRRLIGVNTWVWESPLTDANLPPLLEKIAEWASMPLNCPLRSRGFHRRDGT